MTKRGGRGRAGGDEGFIRGQRRIEGGVKRTEGIGIREGMMGNG